jgi:hypothetical protein
LPVLIEVVGETKRLRVPGDEGRGVIAHPVAQECDEKEEYTNGETTPLWMGCNKLLEVHRVDLSDL